MVLGGAKPTRIGLTTGPVVLLHRRRSASNSHIRVVSQHHRQSRPVHLNIFRIKTTDSIPTFISSEHYRLGLSASAITVARNIYGLPHPRPDPPAAFRRQGVSSAVPQLGINPVVVPSRIRVDGQLVVNSNRFDHTQIHPYCIKWQLRHPRIESRSNGGHHNRTHIEWPCSRSFVVHGICSHPRA